MWQSQALSRSASREQRFYCSARRQMVAVGDCLEEYLDSNAFRRLRSRCYRCMQGRAVRAAWSADLLTDAWPTPKTPQARAGGGPGEAGKNRVAP